MIVEDEPSIADSVVYALQNDGYEATVAGTGEKVRCLVVDEVYDLILACGMASVSRPRRRSTLFRLGVSCPLL